MGQQSEAVDLFVLGAGSGGLAAAKRAASHGARVVIAEDDRVGGTCVIRGCIPKKLMVYASQLGAARELAADFGWAAAPATFSWQRLCTLRDQVVNNLELAHQRHLAQAGVTLVSERAHIEKATTVTTASRRYDAKHILVATGAQPVHPRFDGVEHGIVSDDFFGLSEMPRRAVLVGGGYIAVEFACLLRGLGSEVSLIVRSSLLRGFDSDLAAGMRDAMRASGIDVHEGTQIERVEGTDRKTARVHVRKGDATDVLPADACVVFAVGRKPNTHGLGLQEAGVELDEAGAVCVDAHHTTRVPTVHAIGDVVNRANLTPVAIRAGRLWADRIFAHKDVRMDYDLIPTSVFGQPPIGAVGLTQAAAEDRLGADGVRVFKSRFIPLLFSASPHDRKRASIMKLVVDAKTDKVLGCHMLGDDAPEIIQGFAAAIQAGATKADLDATIALHPTQAEEFVLMR